MKLYWNILMINIYQLLIFSPSIEVSTDGSGNK